MFLSVRLKLGSQNNTERSDNQLEKFIKKKPSIKLPKKKFRSNQSHSSDFLWLKSIAKKLSKIRFKHLRKIKIINLVVILVVISMLSTFLIGITGFFSIKKINSNVSTLYTKSLVPIKYAGEMRKNYLMFQIGINKILLDFHNSDVYLNKIDQYLMNTINLIKTYKANKLDATESKLIDKFDNDLNDFLNIWESIKPNIVNGIKITEADNAAIDKIDSQIINDLNTLIQYELTNADKINSESNRIYKSNNVLFIFILILSFLLIGYMSVVVAIILKKSLKEFIDSLEQLAEGNFSINIDTSGKNEFALMNNALEKTINKVSSSIKLIKNSSDEVSSHAETLSAISQEMTASSTEVSGSIQHVASGASNQASSLMDINTAMFTFGQEVENITLAIEDIGANTKGINDKAAISNTSLKNLAASINEISSAFGTVSTKISGLSANIGQINDITSIINSIADQTNLLALNAAIEAARAGEAGRGFSVVADEIRKLAEQSKNSSTKISKLVSGIGSEAIEVANTTDTVKNNFEDQITIIKDAISSFKAIVDAISEIMPKMDNMTSATLKLGEEKDNILSRVEAASSVAEQISAASEQISASAEEMNASAEEVSATAESLNSMTLEMADHISVFKV